MSQTEATEMESEELPTFMRYINDTALAALKSAQVGFVILMHSIKSSLCGVALHGHVQECFLRHIYLAKK